MKTINISNDIIPLGEFKTNLSKWIKSVQNTGHPLIITQNGRPAGVLLSPTEYDAMMYQKSFTDSVNRGIADAEAGHVYTTSELREELEKRRIERHAK